MEKRKHFSLVLLWLTLEKASREAAAWEMMWRWPTWIPSKLFFLLIFVSQKCNVDKSVDFQLVIMPRLCSDLCKTLLFSLSSFSRSQSSQSQRAVHLQLWQHTHPKNRWMNSIYREKVKYNQFVQGTQAIIKPDWRLRANVVHHSLFWPAWRTDLM